MTFPATTASASGSRGRPDLPYRKADWILEGGAIDGDGTGTFLTTEQCLLNPNRNPGFDKEEVEERLKRDLGATRIVWLGDGLAQRPYRRPCRQSRALRRPEPRRHPGGGRGRSQCRGLCRRRRGAARCRPGRGRHPLARPVERDGEIIPASYMNFYIGNAAVVVPLYGAPNDGAAVEAIQALFPGPRGDRPPRRPYPHRRRQLPLHQPAGAE